MPTRKQVRDAAAAQIKDAYDGEVFSGRIIHANGRERFVDVFFEEGEVERDGIQDYQRGVFLLGVHRSGIVTDDQLDQDGNTCMDALFADPSLGGLVHGITEEGFEYSRRGESVYDSLFLRFFVTYD